MRCAWAFLVVVSSLSAAGAQTVIDRPPARYGIEADLETYPQDTPQHALASVVKTLDRQQIDYLLAQLSDPVFVDTRVQKVHNGNFRGMVEETTDKLSNDPVMIKRLRSLLVDGSWDVGETTATVSLKNSTDRAYLRKVQGRWFLENDNRPREPERKSDSR